jgi:hypothetical protein
MQTIVTVFALVAVVLASEAPPVDLAFYVMSKCPDAKFCEEWLDPVITALRPIVNVSIDYIAKDGGAGQFTCMHGVPECTGNMQQLCAREVAGADSSKWWSFVMCQDATLASIPNNARTCASKAGIEYADIESCAGDGGRGAALFSQSIANTNKRGVRASCTIWQDGKPRCVHDSDWKDCTEGHERKDFIRTICSSYKGKDKPSACL